MTQDNFLRRCSRPQSVLTPGLVHPELRAAVLAARASPPVLTTDKGLSDSGLHGEANKAVRNGTGRQITQSRPPGSPVTAVVAARYSPSGRTQLWAAGAPCRPRVVTAVVWLHTAPCASPRLPPIPDAPSC